MYSNVCLASFAGRPMLDPSQKIILDKIDAALQTLQALRVAFRGPFITPKGRRIYLVDNCILTEAEIIALYESGKFSQETIGKFLTDLRSLQTPDPAVFQSDAEVGQRKRRSQRVMLRLDVLLRFDSHEGGHQQTHASTVVVNAHGGLLESPFQMVVGQQIALINPPSGKEVVCTVVRVHKSSEGYFATAFEFSQPSPQFWAISFPPLDWGLAKEPA